MLPSLFSQLYQRFPDVDTVTVDDYGNVIETEGSYNPYSDPESGLKAGEPIWQGDDDAWPQVAGDIGGMDDPIDAPWRL